MKRVAALILATIASASASKADTWELPLRVATGVDCAQTLTIRAQPGRWRETNPLLAKADGWEIPAVMFAEEQTAEWLVHRVRDRRTREVLGWLCVLAEACTVLANTDHGVPLISVRW